MTPQELRDQAHSLERQAEGLFDRAFRLKDKTEAYKLREQARALRDEGVYLTLKAERLEAYQEQARFSPGLFFRKVPFDSMIESDLGSSINQFGGEQMAKGQRVDIASITDIKRSVKAKPDPKYTQYLADLEGLEPGDALEFTPDADETPRAVMMGVARAAHSLGMKVLNAETERGTVVTEVQTGTWEPKSKTPGAEGEAPRPRGRPRRAES